MEKIVKEFCVYDFDELEENIKKQVIEQERDNQRKMYCDYCLYDDMSSKASDLLKDYFGITSDYLTTYYDLSYCQGSGAMVEFDINIKDLNNKYKIFSDSEIELLNNKYVVSNIRVRHHDNFYYHEYTFGIDYDFYMGLEYDDIKEDYKITESEFNTLEDRLHALLDSSRKHNAKSEFVKDIIELNKELTSYGYDCIEYFWNCDEKEIIEHIYNNDCKYYGNGDVF